MPQQDVGLETSVVNDLEVMVQSPQTDEQTAGTLVLVHGVGNGMDAWDRVVAALPSKWRIVRYSLRGHGRSKRPSGPYTLNDFVEDHNQLMSSLELDHYHLVGCSLGGLIAQGVALTRPLALDRLILISSIAGRTAQQREAALERLRLLEEAGGPAGMAEQSGERWFTADFLKTHPEIVRERLDAYRRNHPASYLASYRVLAENDLVHDLDRIQNETLVVTGQFDIGSPPAMAQNIADRVPRSTLRIVPNQKHQLLVEVPTVIASYISDFAEDGAQGVRGDE